MSYELTFSGVSKKEERESEEEHRWPRETINITPSLSRNLMTVIEPMTGQNSGCHAFGAQLLDVSANEIVIHFCCQICRETLIRQITSSLGKKITIQVD